VYIEGLSPEYQFFLDVAWRAVREALALSQGSVCVLESGSICQYLPVLVVGHSMSDWFVLICRSKSGLRRRLIVSLLVF